MKNLFDGEHKKSKIALAAVLVWALVLPLCSCGMGGIEGKALKYLASRYSGEFTIISAERESRVGSKAEKGVRPDQSRGMAGGVGATLQPVFGAERTRRTYRPP